MQKDIAIIRYSKEQLLKYCAVSAITASSAVNILAAMRPLKNVNRNITAPKQNDTHAALMSAVFALSYLPPPTFCATNADIEDRKDIGTMERNTKSFSAMPMLAD